MICCPICHTVVAPINEFEGNCKCKRFSYITDPEGSTSYIWYFNTENSRVYIEFKNSRLRLVKYLILKDEFEEREIKSELELEELINQVIVDSILMS